jgi:CheY-like chemotaxis protein
LKDQRIDCLVLGEKATSTADALFEASQRDGDGVLTRIPVIVYGDAVHTERDGNVCKRLGERYTVLKAQSSDRLFDLVALQLHKNVESLPESRRIMLRNLHQSDGVLAGKKVLVVDDDMRNIFALSTVLEEHEMQVVSADNGRDAIRILKDEPDVDIVLMDIMMPEMDGMETMRAIRMISNLSNLPIVAVTAKAMKGDREKCLEAGAWDYLSKPVDPEQMLGVLRAWLRR